MDGYMSVIAQLERDKIMLEAKIARMEQEFADYIEAVTTAELIENGEDDDYQYMTPWKIKRIIKPD